MANIFHIHFENLVLLIYAEWCMVQPFQVLWINDLIELINILHSVEKVKKKYEIRMFKTVTPLALYSQCIFRKSACFVFL